MRWLGGAVVLLMGLAPACRKQARGHHTPDAGVRQLAPPSNGDSARAAGEARLVTLARDGVLSLDGVPLDGLDQLRERLTSDSRVQAGQIGVVLQADAQVPAGSVTALLRALGQAGVQNVSFAIAHGAPPPPRLPQPALALPTPDPLEWPSVLVTKEAILLATQQRAVVRIERNQPDAATQLGRELGQLKGRLDAVERIEIAADDTVEYQAVITAMDAAISAGFPDVSFTSEDSLTTPLR